MALTFRYHGIAAAELEASRELAKEAGVNDHRFVRLPDLRESAEIGGRLRLMPPTYIPSRNAVFYSLAGGLAEEIGADLVIGGHNRDDSGRLSDARPEFFSQLSRALRSGSKALSKRRFRVALPLSGKTKPEVVKLAAMSGVPLGMTWSCHKGGPMHCWDCPGCQGRVVSFMAAGVADPLRQKVTLR